MKKKISLIFILLSFVMLAVGCKKIATPNEESKALFGTWHYKSNSGGFSGGGGSTKFNADYWIEFNDKGIYKVYQGSKKKQKSRYKIEMRESITGKVKATIVYQGGSMVNHTFEVIGNTLYLYDEVYDGYMYHFEKK